MTDKYAVIGNPIAHSKSPQIHQMFAAQTVQDISYEAILAPLDSFAATVERLRAGGYKGCNVTVPFKFEALQSSTRVEPRAKIAKAVNTLKFANNEIIGTVQSQHCRSGFGRNVPKPLLGVDLLVIPENRQFDPAILTWGTFTRLSS